MEDVSAHAIMRDILQTHSARYFHMTRTKVALTICMLAFSGVLAIAQDRSTGTIKGKVRLQGAGPVADVVVSLRQKDREITHVATNKKGEFQLKNVSPGSYGLTFRKPGLSVGALEDVVVRAGKTHELPDRLVLTVNESAIAKLGGSVFNEGGFSVPNVRIELSRIEPDGRLRRIDGRVTNESGQFIFRLPPDKAMYRVTAKAEGLEPKTQDIEIDGALVYRVAITIERPPKQ